MHDVGARVLKQVSNEVAACDAYRAAKDPGCARCVIACPAKKDSFVAQNIQALNDATVGKKEPPSEIVEFAYGCMQTARCVAPCPAGLRRDLMMLALKSRLKPPARYTRYNLIRGTRLTLKGRLAQKAYNLAQRRKLGPLNAYNEKRPTDHAPLLFYFGCYINSPEVCRATLALADSLGEEYAVLGGMSTCCGWPQYLQGNFELASQYLENLRADIFAVNPQKVVTGCMECMAALDYLKQTHRMAFEPLTVAAWLTANHQKLQLAPLTDKIIYHDSCHRCIKTNDRATAPGLLATLMEGGAEKVARFKPAADKSLCCAKYNFEYTPEHNARLRQSKFKQAVQADAEVMVAECLTCAETYAQADPPQGLKVMDLASYVARALKTKPN